MATVYQDKAAGGQAHSSASPAAFPARAAIFGRVIGSYAGSVASISARGRAAMGVPLLRRGQTRSLLSTRDAGLLGQMYPGRQILRRVPGDTRLVVCEPIGDLPGAWNEVPQASYG